ncbi:hypothetical protein [Streptomyces sp. NPDC055749]
MAGAHGLGELPPRVAVALGHPPGPWQVSGAQVETLELPPQPGHRGVQQVVHGVVQRGHIAHQGQQIKAARTGTRDVRGRVSAPIRPATADRHERK